MSTSKIALLLAFAVAIAVFFALDLDRHLSVEQLRHGAEQMGDFQKQHPAATGALFFLAYVSVAGLSLPGAGVMTLLAGALFSLPWGVALVSFASVAGACLAFLFSRYVFRDLVQRRFASQLAPVNAGIRREGGFYLLTLRLVPFPYFLVNLLMGLTPIRATTFAWVSQLGMLPATVVLVNAGKQLSQISQPGDVFSVELLLSLALIGILPLLSKRLVEMYRRRTGKGSAELPVPPRDAGQEPSTKSQDA